MSSLMVAPVIAAAVPASVPKVVEAVRILNDAGLMITDQGKGSFVRPQMPLIRPARRTQVPAGWMGRAARHIPGRPSLRP
jgi:hypothetical protein